MKKITLLIGVLVCGIFAEVQSQCTILSNAITGTVTLETAGGSTTRSGVAYNPIKDLYYSVNAGTGTFPCETYSATGGASVASVGPGGDYRGLWWNSNLDELEGNAFGNGGVMQQDLNGTTGYAVTGISTVLTANQPNSQSIGDYDDENNEIIYFDNGSIFIKNRANNANVATLTVTGLPVPISLIYPRHVFSTGCSGIEYGLYDNTNKRFYFLDNTGAYVDQSQLPLTAPTLPGNPFGLSYANDMLWLYNTTSSEWESFQVLVPCPSPLVTVSSLTDVACNGDSTGSITISASGGTGPYSYMWTTGDTVVTAGSLPVGTYTVSVIDATGCPSDTTIDIISPDTLISSFVNTHNPCFGDALGESTVSTVGGVSPYSYFWPSGGTSATETGLASGTHAVTVSDANNCSVSYSTTITSPDSLAISIDAITDVFCQGEMTGSIATTTSGGVIPYVLQWDDLNGQISPTAINLGEGLYTLMATDANGCQANVVASVGFTNPQPALNLGPDINAGAQFYDINTAPAGFTYAWSNGSNAQIIRVFNSGTYTLTITDANGCTNVDEIVIGQIWATGLSELKADEGLSLYPNPTSGEFTLNLEGWNESEVKIEISNAVGQVLLTHNPGKPGASYTTNFDLRHFAKGIYFLKSSSEDHYSVRKILIE